MIQGPEGPHGDADGRVSARLTSHGSAWHHRSGAPVPRPPPQKVLLPPVWPYHPGGQSEPGVVLPPLFWEPEVPAHPRGPSAQGSGGSAMQEEDALSFKCTGRRGRCTYLM